MTYFGNGRDGESETGLHKVEGFFLFSILAYWLFRFTVFSKISKF